MSDSSSTAKRKFVTVDDLGEMELKRRMKNRETYQILCAKVHERIQRSFEKGGTTLKYTVPSFHDDRPKYDPLRAARYIRDKLRHNGYKVVVEDDGVTMHVDWSRASRPDTNVLLRHRAATAQPQQQRPRRLSRGDMASQLHALKQKLRA